MKFRIQFFLCAIWLIGSAAGGYSQPSQELPTPFEKNGTNKSATYDEMMTFYKVLAAASPMVKIFEYEGGTDIGKPLHLVVISKSKIFHPVPLKQADTRIVLINNGIHAGEPCGIDASMILARDLVLDKIYLPLLEHIVVCIIPAYNVDGMLNRGPFGRANQNGPEEHGFRGNAKNLDLNRDFAKEDSRNARTFAKIFTEWRPDIFIDTHTSNGADYPAVMTYIPTHPDKLDPGLAQYMETVLNPEMKAKMKESQYEMCPYVQTKGWEMSPDSGITGFLDSPRYATGYASLFNTIAYTTEAHMLKPFEDRVYATYHFCLNMLKIVNRDRKQIGRQKKEAIEVVRKQAEYVIRWKPDMRVSTPLMFTGYTANLAPSAITGFPRLSYDQTNPWTREIPFYNRFAPEIKVQKPVAYIIPQAWEAVIQRLQLSGVEMRRMSEDQKIEVQVYRIEAFEAGREPYEGHFPLREIRVTKEAQQLQYWAGDYVVYTDQEANRFLVEMLEPQATDSYLHWNFFDAVLMRKEYFSPYVFEKTAVQMLETDPKLKLALQEKIAQDTAFAKSDWAQMDFLYRHSSHYEGSHLRYPVARLEKNVKISLQK